MQAQVCHGDIDSSKNCQTRLRFVNYLADKLGTKKNAKREYTDLARNLHEGEMEWSGEP